MTCAKSNVSVLTKKLKIFQRHDASYTYPQGTQKIQKNMQMDLLSGVFFHEKKLLPSSVYYKFEKSPTTLCYTPTYVTLFLQENLHFDTVSKDYFDF